MTTWTCGCGDTGTSEAAAQRHAKKCGQMGAPRTWNGSSEPPVWSVTESRPTLTLKGWVAVLAAEAEPYDWTRRGGE